MDDFQKELADALTAEGAIDGPTIAKAIALNSFGSGNAAAVARRFMEANPQWRAGYVPPPVGFTPPTKPGDVRKMTVEEYAAYKRHLWGEAPKNPFIRAK